VNLYRVHVRGFSWIEHLRRVQSLFTAPPNRDCSVHPARSGFSLIELGVVFQIVVLLVAVAGPSLQSARRQSRQSVCLERFRGIGVASRTYQAADPNGWYIPVHPAQYCQCLDRDCHGSCYEPLHIGAYEWGGKSGIGSPGDPRAARRNAQLTGPYAWQSSKYGTAAGVGPATRPLNRILYKHGFRDNLGTRSYWGLDTQLELDAYRCPADDGPPSAAHCRDWVRHPQRSSYDHFGTSYAANSFMIASAGGGDMQSNSPYMRPAGRVPNPARTLAYEENIGRWAWACKRELPECEWIGEGVDPGPTKMLRGWHGKNWSFNRAFIDSHAEHQKIYIEGTEDADGYALHYRSEQVYPEGDPLQETYRCIIVRGDGWQKDTLPAPPIPTGVWHDGQGRPSYEGCVHSD